MKISLRSLLVVVTMFAIALGWWLDHLRLQKAINRLNAENTELMGRIVPPGGFAFSSGLGAKTVLLNSSSEDRKQMLQLLDHSFSHGENPSIPMEILESPNEGQRGSDSRE